jgi:hypothetical protein
MTTKVYIPGSMIATIGEHGRITGYTFTPAAADAGYFGDKIVVAEGDDIESKDFFDLVYSSLTFTSNNSAVFTTEWEC